MPLSGGSFSTLATGLGRPVSAAADVSGRVLVAEENPPGLVIVAGGAAIPAVPAGRLRSVDEVVVRGSLAYVTDLAAGTLDAVDPSSGRIAQLVTGSPAPQGLALAADGRLVLSDSMRAELVTLRGCA
jgi:glucose/arabinose dehydrogenase